MTSKPQSRESKNPTRDAVTSLFTSFAGAKNTLVIHKPYIAFCQGDHLAALFLSQLLYWTDRTDDPDGWVPKSYEQWYDELYMTQYQINRAINGDKRNKNGGFCLKDIGVQTKLKPSRFHGGGATLHYRVDMEMLQQKVYEFLGLTVINNVDNAVVDIVDNDGYQQRSQRPLNNVDNPYIETLAETMVEIIEERVSPTGETPSVFEEFVEGVEFDVVDEPEITLEIPQPVMPDDYAQAIAATGYAFKVGDNMARVLEPQLRGRAAKGERKSYNISPAMDAVEIVAFGMWYTRTYSEQSDKPSQKAERIFELVTDFRDWYAARPQVAERAQAHLYKLLKIEPVAAVPAQSPATQAEIDEALDMSELLAALEGKGQ